MMRRLVCLIVGHRRRKGHSRRQGGHYYADCTRCGTALFREPEGKWRAARPLDYMPRTLDLAGGALDPVGGTADPSPAEPPDRSRKAPPPPATE